MQRTDVAIIGAGQAGLAVSYLLTAASVDHVVLERGRTAESWRSRQWDSLRLLTPNWMSRLPGWSYRGPDPAGFMSAAGVADYLHDYAAAFGAPVVSGAAVRAVHRSGDGYLVVSDAGRWQAKAIVIATGYSVEPAVPDVAEELGTSVVQLTTDSYRGPADVADGGVLVVGASATGTQFADELAAAGRDVVLAVGRHARIPRRYRGMDIMWWLDSMGVFDRPIRPGDRSDRPDPSLQLVGSADHREIDLPALAGRGIRLVGRVADIDQGVVALADNLATTTAAADIRMHRVLQRIDQYAAATGLDAEVDPPTRPAPSVSLRNSFPGRPIDLAAEGIRTVIWATGYRRRYPWLHLPVLDATGEIAHTAGRTALPGVMVIGMRQQTRRSSTFLDGVRHDAAIVADRLISDLAAAPALERRAS
jgi:putative flavoprotein involved in K+ transport